MASRSIKGRLETLEAAERARQEAIIPRVLDRFTDAEIELLAAYYERRDNTLGGTEPTPEEEPALWNYFEAFADVYEETYKRPYPRPSTFMQQAEAI